MTMQTEIDKLRPRAKFTLTRDSVCAGDDVFAPHEMSVETYLFTDPAVLAQELSSGYLPSVAGFGHWWECILNETSIATISFDGKAKEVGEITYADNNSVYFRYHSATF